MSSEPNVAQDEADPQRADAYLAEEIARENAVAVLGLEIPDRVPAAELTEFTSRALDAAGWDAGMRPTFALDVADDSNFSGWHSGVEREIHLHPRLLDPWTVLHEVAHWLDNRDGHGPRFCANYASLVRAGLGQEAAEELLAQFEVFGVDVDMDWLT